MKEDTFYYNILSFKSDKRIIKILKDNKYDLTKKDGLGYPYYFHLFKSQKLIDYLFNNYSIDFFTASIPYTLFEYLYDSKMLIYCFDKHINKINLTDVIKTLIKIEPTTADKEVMRYVFNKIICSDIDLDIIDVITLYKVFYNNDIAVYNMLFNKYQLSDNRIISFFNSNKLVKYISKHIYVCNDILFFKSIFSSSLLFVLHYLILNHLKFFKQHNYVDVFMIKFIKSIFYVSFNELLAIDMFDNYYNEIVDKNVLTLLKLIGNDIKYRFDFELFNRFLENFHNIKLMNNYRVDIVLIAFALNYKLTFNYYSKYYNMNSLIGNYSLNELIASSKSKSNNYYAQFKTKDNNMQISKNTISKIINGNLNKLDAYSTFDNGLFESRVILKSIVNKYKQHNTNTYDFNAYITINNKCYLNFNKLDNITKYNFLIGCLTQTPEYLCNNHSMCNSKLLNHAVFIWLDHKNKMFYFIDSQFSYDEFHCFLFNELDEYFKILGYSNAFYHSKLLYTGIQDIEQQQYKSLDLLGGYCTMYSNLLIELLLNVKGDPFEIIYSFIRTLKGTNIEHLMNTYSNNKHSNNRYINNIGKINAINKYIMRVNGKLSDIDLL